MSIRAKDWEYLLKKDETDPRLDYPALLKRAKPGLAAELTVEKFQQRDEACLKAIRNLGDALQKANADVAVVFGDDQQEQFHDDNMPMFAIYHGKTLPVVKDSGLRPSGWKVSMSRHARSGASAANAGVRPTGPPIHSDPGPRGATRSSRPAPTITVRCARPTTNGVKTAC